MYRGGTNIIMELLRATPKENIFVEEYYAEYFEKREWYKYFIEDGIVYAQGRTHNHTVGFKKEEFYRKFIVKNFFDLSHENLRKKYRKSKEECIYFFRRNLHIDDSVYINIANSTQYLIKYYIIEINNVDTQDVTYLKRSKDTLSIIFAEYSGKYYYKKNRIDADIINMISNNVEYFKFFSNTWEEWYSIHQKYYDGKYIYDSEGDEY